MRRTYTTIENSIAPREYRNFPAPLTLDQASESEWLNIQNQLQNDFQQFKSPVFQDSPERLMHGTINLVNRVLTEDISTLVFLDKSARPAAYLFRTTWDSLQKAGKIPLNTPKPLIKFLNVGSFEDYKHSSNRALSLAKEIIPAKDLPAKGVLIVDEIIQSGGSTRRASRTLDDLYGIEVPGMANFDYTPLWYDDDQSKGIKDDNNVSLALFEKIENLDDQMYEELRSAALSEKPKMALRMFILKHNLLSTFPLWRVNRIVNYFKSSGKFLSLKDPNRKNRQALVQHRRYLKKMAELTVPLIRTK